TDGFDGIADSLNTEPVRAVIKQWVDECNKTTDKEKCRADSTMMELVDHGARAFASARLTDIFRQIHEDETQGGSTKFAASIAEFVFQSIDDAHSPSLVLDPSSIPPYGGGATTAMHFVPYRANYVFGQQGFSGAEVSWSPSF